MKRVCKNCLFLQDEMQMLSCHKYPPVLNVNGVAVWPPVRANQWCGQYEPKPETETMSQITDDVHKIAEQL